MLFEYHIPRERTAAEMARFSIAKAHTSGSPSPFRGEG